MSDTAKEAAKKLNNFLDANSAAMMAIAKMLEDHEKRLKKLEGTSG